MPVTSVPPSRLAWTSPPQAVALICRGATFATAAQIAVVVGTLLTLVNQGGVLVAGEAGPVTYVRVVVNYLIPYVVSSIGYLAPLRIRPAVELGEAA